MPAPDDDPRSRGAFLTRIIATVLGLCVAYVLSYGPMSALAFRLGSMHSWKPDEPPQIHPNPWRLH